MRAALAVATGKTRIAFSPEQRRRLALRGKALTPEERDGGCQLVRPATILTWFRQLVAQQYDSSAQRKKLGRPRTANDIRAFVTVKTANAPHETQPWTVLQPSWPVPNERASHY